jgi:hypothetical protein
MNKYRRRALERLLANPAPAEGFAFREAIAVISTLGSMGCFNGQFVRLTESGGEPRLGYFEVVSLNGISPFESSQHMDRFGEAIEQVQIRFTCLDESGAAVAQLYDRLDGLQELVVITG